MSMGMAVWMTLMAGGLLTLLATAIVAAVRVSLKDRRLAKEAGSPDESKPV